MPVSYPSKDALERAKLSLELLLYLAVAFLFIIAISKYDKIIRTIEESLHNAGVDISEFSAFGLKFQFVTEKVATIQADLSEISQKYTHAAGYIRCLKQGSCSSEQIVAIDRIVQSNGSGVQDVVKGAEKQIDSIIKAAETSSGEIAAKSQPPADTDTPRSWMALVGADKVLTSAQDEQKALERAGYTDNGILLADGWYRTVAYFSSRDEANSELAGVAKAVGRQPYIREFATWCVNASQGDGFTRCSHR